MKIRILLLVLFSIFDGNSIAAFAEAPNNATVVKTSEYFVESLIVDHVNDGRIYTCVRIDNGSKKAWFLAEPFNTYYKQHYAGEVALTEFLSYETAEGSDAFLHTCMMDGTTPKNGNPFKEGKYRVLKIKGDTTIIMEGNSHIEYDNFWIDIKL